MEAKKEYTVHDGIIYCRVSSANQKDGVSLDVQEQLCRFAQKVPITQLTREGSMPKVRDGRWCE